MTPIRSHTRDIFFGILLMHGNDKFLINDIRKGDLCMEKLINTSSFK